MSFKPFNIFQQSILALLLLTSVSNIGCSAFLNDKTKKSNPVNLSFKNNQCLDQVATHVENYFKLKDKENDIRNSVVCINTAITEFSDYTVGANKDFYTSAQLKYFFERYLIKKELSSDLVRNLMLIKQVLVFGDKDTVSREQLKELKEFLNVLGDELESLRPYLPWVLGQKIPDLKSESSLIDMRSAFDQAEVSLERIIHAVHFDKVKYSSKEFAQLVEALKQFGKESTFALQLKSVQKYLPLIDRARNIIVGNPLDLRGVNELTEVTKVLLKSYRSAIILREIYHVSQGEDDLISNPIILKNLLVTLDEGIENLIIGLSLKPQSVILFKDIEGLMAELKDDQGKVLGVPEKVLMRTLRTAVSRFLDEQHSAFLDGLTGTHLRKVQLEVRAFALRQDVITQLFQNSLLVSPLSVTKNLSQISVDDRIDRLYRNNPEESDYLKRHWLSFQRILNKDYTYKFNKQRQWIFDSGKKELNYQDLTLLNVAHSVSQNLVGAYAKNAVEANRKNSMTIQDMRMFDQEFVDIGAALGVSDKRNKDGGASRAKEADLFTRSGNGDGMVQFDELVELVLSIQSSGFRSFTTMWNKAESCRTHKKDYFNNFYLNAGCLKRKFKNHYPEIFPHLPRMMNWLKSLNAENLDLFYDSTMNVAKVCRSDEQGIETADRRKFVMILTYIEALVQQYDLDQNGYFDDTELNQSLERFKPFLTEAIKKRVSSGSPRFYKWMNKFGFDWTSLTGPVYRYLLKYGVVPSAGDLVSEQFFVFSPDSTSPAKVLAVTLGVNEPKIDRMNIAKVFSALKTELSSGDEDLCQH